MNSEHCFLAEHCGVVACDFTSPWTCLSDLKEEIMSKTCFPEAETVLEVMLLRADLFFQHAFGLHTAFVCDTHHNMLMQPFYIKTHSKCDTCMCVKGKRSKNKGGLRNINISQAITLFEAFELKNSYGKLICSHCRSELAKREDFATQTLHHEAFSCIFGSESSCCVESKDPDYHPPIEPLISDEKVKEQRLAMNTFLEAFGSKTTVLRTKSYKNLSHRAKRRYIHLAKFFFTSAASFLAEDDTKMLVRDALSALNDMSAGDSNIKLDGNFCQVLTGVSEAYNNAETSQSRREILSIVAPKVSLKLLQLFIPGLTDYRFYKARFHAANYTTGASIKEEARLVQRFSDRQIAHFVDFIISPHVCIDLPFGEKTLKLSSGIELYVPNTIRNMGPTRIIEQYLLYCKEMCVSFEPLARSSLFTILEVCKASTRKSLQGIDYFAGDATEGFEGIKKMIESNLLLSSDSNRLVKNLKRARLYLKSDYKVHVSRSSSVADHCCVYALSDPNKKDFAHDCDHKHEELCPECSNITSTLDEIEHLIETSETNRETLDRSLNRFRLHRESIEAWKAHLLRSINQDLCREELLDKLSGDEIYINLDWAMKFLPTKSREPQSEFFGKRGISWHITVVMKKCSNTETSSNNFDESDDISDVDAQFDDCNITDASQEVQNEDSLPLEARDNGFEYRVFVHVFDECAQDSETVLAILKDVLSRVKNSNPEIEKAFIRSDNAGCYHSADTIVSALQISKLTGVTIKRVDFCDPQGGKGPCDRYAAVIKSNVRRYLNENHNVTNASEFVEACHSYKGVKGVLALNCKIEKRNVKKNKKCTIKQITNYFTFEYRKEGLLVHRSWSVGPDLLMYWSRLNIDQHIRDIITNENEAYVHNWIKTKEKYERDTVEINDCNIEENKALPNINVQKQLYECDVEEGCTSKFMKFGNLINHILVGKHRRSVERFSLSDTAMKVYHCKLEEVGNRRMISIDLNSKETDRFQGSALPNGWALPTRKPNKEFSEKQREYLERRFDEGVSGIKHWRPRNIVIDMENLKLQNNFYFSASEILTQNQIRSFFGRMKRGREAAASIESIAEHMDIDDNIVKNIDEGHDEEEMDVDLEILEDFQDTEATLEEATVIEDTFLRAKQALGTSDA